MPTPNLQQKKEEIRQRFYKEFLPEPLEEGETLLAFSVEAEESLNFFLKEFDSLLAEKRKEIEEELDGKIYPCTSKIYEECKFCELKYKILSILSPLDRIKKQKKEECAVCEGKNWQPKIKGVIPLCKKHEEECLSETILSSNK